MPPESKLISAGGQALIEGVLIRAKSQYAIAVRNPKGKIITTLTKINPIKFPILKWPIIRGMVALIEMLIIGTKALAYSASIASGEEEEGSWWQLVLSLLLGIGFALVLFKYVPLVVATWASHASSSIAKSSFLFALIDGLVKVALFVLYV